MDYHARVDEAKPKDGFTALKAAASKGHSDIVSELTHLPCPPFTFLEVHHRRKDDRELATVSSTVSREDVGTARCCRYPGRYLCSTPTAGTTTSCPTPPRSQSIIASSYPPLVVLLVGVWGVHDGDGMAPAATNSRGSASPIWSAPAGWPLPTSPCPMPRAGDTVPCHDPITPCPLSHKDGVPAAQGRGPQPGRELRRDDSP